MKSTDKFTTELKVKKLGKEKGIKQYQLVQPLRYGKYIVPIGFKTNLASIPLWIKWVYPKFYYYLKTVTSKSSVLHDYLYEGKLSRKECDIIYRESMETEEVNPFISDIFYLCVRMFGGGSYGVK